MTDTCKWTPYVVQTQCGHTAHADEESESGCCPGCNRPVEYAHAEERVRAMRSALREALMARGWDAPSVEPLLQDADRRFKSIPTPPRSATK